MASRAKVAGPTPLTVVPLRVVGADVAGPRHAVTRPRHRGVDVASAATPTTHAARLGGVAVVTRRTPAE